MAKSEKFKVEPLSTSTSNELAPNMVVERVMELSESDLQNLCESTERSIVAGGGVAGTVQTGTVAVRALSTGTTGGLANPVFSIFEAFLAILITILAILAPLIAVGLIAIGLIYAVRFIQERKAKKALKRMSA